MKCTWTFDFSTCKDPAAAAKAFVNKIDGIGIQDEGYPEVELWAFNPEPDPDLAIAGNHEAALSEKELHEMLDAFLSETARKCRGIV